MSESTMEPKRCVCGNPMGQWTNCVMGCQSCGRRETLACKKPGHLGETIRGKGFSCFTCRQGLPDPVNPSHYVKRGIEVRHVIRAFECTYNVGTAVAYLLRAPFKGRYLEDIRKAIQHLTFELEDKGGGDGVGNGGTRNP